VEKMSNLHDLIHTVTLWHVDQDGWMIHF